MSRSPERMSSYRRHFEGAFAAPALYQVRVSSPSPTRREVRRSASYTVTGAPITVARKSRMSSKLSGSLGALCFGMSMGLGPKLDLDAASAENQAFMSTRSGERQEMVELNDRLALYIEKVRSLESQNKLLETEIEALQNRYVKPSGLRQLYENQLKELERLAEQMKAQRDMALTAKDALSDQLEALKSKYEEALEGRKKAEQEIEGFRPDVDKATSARIALEKQLENLEVELAFMQRVHKEEIEELMEQIYRTVARVDVAFGLPDLSSALKQIQAQYDSIAAKNLQEMDAWYKTKFDDLSQATTMHVKSVRGFREEMANYKKDLLGKERELESMKTRNEHLEAQIRDALERHQKEEDELQERIDNIKTELKVTKEKIALLLREYQELLNVKMSLEIEIITYRKLIEGEDIRLSSMVRGLSLAGANLTASAAPEVASAPPAAPEPKSAPVPEPEPEPVAEEAPEVADEPEETPVNGEKPPVEVISSESQTDMDKLEM